MTTPDPATAKAIRDIRDMIHGTIRSRLVQISEQQKRTYDEAGDFDWKLPPDSVVRVDKLWDDEVEDLATVLVRAVVNELRPDLSDIESWINLNPHGWEKIGVLGIDSGCGYISMGDGNGENDGWGRNDQISFDTGWGDGGYEVEAIKLPSGRTAAIRIIFIEDGSCDIFGDMFKEKR